MDLALYAPGLGYYAAGTTKFGEAGDFVTAPELTPLFARALARQVGAILATVPGGDILELGAGSGRLATDLLDTLNATGRLPQRYLILEPSPELRARQYATLCGAPPEILARIVWLDALPSSIQGAVIANELLDAIPVHVVARRNGAWLERGVVIHRGVDDPAGGSGRTAPRAGDQRPRFGWAEREASAPIAALAAARFAPGGDDYTSELNPAAEALVATLGRRLKAGALLLIDYGFPASEFYHPQRADGTLMCHYRHRAHADPFLWPGLTDITAHVDFTAIAMAGVRAGLHVAGYTAQAPFLVGCGIVDALAGVGAPESMAYIKAASAVQKLLSPAEMGELFKVLALARTDGIAWPGFALGDRSHRL